MVTLDPAKGSRYTNSVHDYDRDNNLDCIYNIIAQERDWVNPIVVGKISWERESSCTSNLDKEIEQWQNWLHEVTTLNCNMMIRSLCCMEIEIRDLPMYDQLIMVDDFLNKFEIEVPEQQRFDSLKWALRAMPTRWWGTHQRSFEDWRECRRMILMWFGKPQMQMKIGYDGQKSLHAHFSRWVQAYGMQPK